jgi:hypothetical protein
LQPFPACRPGLFAAPSDPVWTETGLCVNSNATVCFPATGTWTGNGNDPDPIRCGPEGGSSNKGGGKSRRPGSSKRPGMAFFEQALQKDRLWRENGVRAKIFELFT